MTRAEAIAQLEETGELSTGLLEPLGIPFETWLRFAQQPPAEVKEITRKLILAYRAGES